MGRGLVQPLASGGGEVAAEGAQLAGAELGKRLADGLGRGLAQQRQHVAVGAVALASSQPRARATASASVGGGRRGIRRTSWCGQGAGGSGVGCIRPLAAGVRLVVRPAVGRPAQNGWAHEVARRGTGSGAAGVGGDGGSWVAVAPQSWLERGHRGRLRPKRARQIRGADHPRGRDHLPRRRRRRSTKHLGGYRPYLARSWSALARQAAASGGTRWRRPWHAIPGSGGGHGRGRPGRGGYGDRGGRHRPRRTGRGGWRRRAAAAGAIGCGGPAPPVAGGLLAGTAGSSSRRWRFLWR
jgi:translation initiation factor IF-2